MNSQTTEKTGHSFFKEKTGVKKKVNVLLVALHFLVDRKRIRGHCKE